MRLQMDGAAEQGIEDPGLFNSERCLDSKASARAEVQVLDAGGHDQGGVRPQRHDGDEPVPAAVREKRLH